MILRRWFWFLVASILLSATTAAAGVSQIPKPARIGGTVTGDGTQLTQATGTGYTFTVTKQNGTAYVPAATSSGLNASDWYVIDIPIYNAGTQPGGANPGDSAVIHVYKNGTELTVSSPTSGQLTVGAEGSTTRINLTSATGPTTHTVTFTAGTGGALTGTTTQTVAHGGNCSAVTAVPNTNYKFMGWTGDYTGTGNPLTVTNVTADMNITANFAGLVSGGPADGATLTIDKGTFNAAPTSAIAPAGAPANFLFGLMSFTIEGLAVGGTVNIVVTMPGNIPAGAVYYKYQNGQFTQFTNVSGLGDGNATYTITITDGGPGDEDGQPNGKIVEPGGPAIAPPIPTLNEWGMILFMVLFAISAVYMIGQKRRLT